MKSYKKAASAFMAAAMAATMLAGCGSKTADTQTTAQETLPQSASGEFSYPISSDEVLTYWCALNQNVSANYSNLGETPFARELMKETGVTIDFQHPPANQGKEQFSLLLADGSLPDLMEYAWMNYPGGPEKAIQDGNIMRYLPMLPYEYEVRFYEELDENIFLMKLIPGIRPRVLQSIFENYDCIIVESFGVGGIPQSIAEEFYRLCQEHPDKLVVMATQVAHEGSDMTVYEVGHNMKEY